MDKGAVQKRFDNIAEGVMHHAVPVRGGADQAHFGIVNVKIMVPAMSVSLCLQLVLNAEQLFFQIQVKKGGGWFEAFALLRFLGRQQEVLKTGDLFE